MMHFCLPPAISNSIPLQSIKRRIRPRSPADLSNRDVIILKGSHHHGELEALSESQEGLSWREIDSGDTGNLLEAVVDETADIAILDRANSICSKGCTLERRKPLFEDTLQTVWYMPALERATEWQTLANTYLENEIESGNLDRLEERYFGDIAFASRIESFTFQQAVKSKLPQWQSLIEKNSR